VAAEHVAVEVFISSEIDYRIKLISDCAECDLAPIRKETTSGSADRLWQAALNTQSKRFSVAAFENEKTVLADLVGHATRCALSVIRFKQGKWRDIAVGIEQKAKKSAS
jgi:hypothetical protein